MDFGNNKSYCNVHIYEHWCKCSNTPCQEGHLLFHCQYQWPSLRTEHEFISNSLAEKLQCSFHLWGASATRTDGDLRSTLIEFISLYKTPSLNITMLSFYGLLTGAKGSQPKQALSRKNNQNFIAFTGDRHNVSVVIVGENGKTELDWAFYSHRFPN